VRSEISANLNLVKQTLPERYRQVLTLYYDRELKMREIAEILGVNESRVSQIHKSAVESMQAVLSAKGIRSTAAF
jgi:RNA polymerase sigma factor for flagellar operon FliA